MLSALLLASVTPMAPRPITAAEQAEIKQKAEYVLFDAPSARWKWNPRNDPDLYCGLVNAKNTFGGYAGWWPFIYSKGEFTLIGEANIAALKPCLDMGYFSR